jgi:cytochrome c peroxidase
MRHLIHSIIFVWISVFIASSVTHGRQSLSQSGPSKTSMAKRALTQKQSLGKKLFFDKNLSTPVGQACTDCHAPETGFANPNSNYPVSQGVHKDRFGNRNDLPAAYAAFSPPFQYDADEGLYVGGQFWDGRVANLAEQAKGPFLNALEMANPDEKTVVEKVRKSEYAGLFREVFGAAAFDDPNKAYDMIADAIAEYEKSSELNQFSSKYDLYLAGKVALTEQERRGLELFEDEDRGKCAECHPNRPLADGTPPLFTDFTYDNLGVPKNPENPFYYLPKEFNPDGVSYIDLGLGGVLNKPSENGKFKVPSLRNIAKTAPYFHNGFFKNLRQVVVFYNTRDVGPWAPPEVRANVNREELGDLGLTEQEVDDIVAFMQILTDGYNSSEK